MLLKLLMNHHANVNIPVKSVGYKDLKLILDFIYYGEVDVPVTDVASAIKAAELMEMASLKLCISHCCEKKFSGNNPDKTSVKDESCVSGVNLIGRDGNHLLEKEVPSVCVCKNEERVLFEGENVYLHSVSGLKTKYLNNSQDLSDMLEKGSLENFITNSIDILKETAEDDDMNDELCPLTFVSVPSVTDSEKPIYDDQDNMCYDSFLKDPLGECSGDLDGTKESSLKRESAFESVPLLKVKMEPKEESDVPDSVVLAADKLLNSCHKLTDTEGYVFEATEQESGLETNLVNGRTLHSESFPTEGTHDQEIKLESTCEISATTMKEEKSYETGNCFKSSVGDDIEAQQLGEDCMLVKCGAQHNLIIDYHQDVNEELCAASTCKISTAGHLEVGNKTPAIYETRGSLLTKMKLSSVRKKLKKRTCNERPNSYSTHDTSLDAKVQFNTQDLVQSDYFAMRPRELRVRRVKSGNVPNLKTCIEKTNVESLKKVSHPKSLSTLVGDKQFQCEICKSSFLQKIQLTVHKRSHSGEKPFKCEICEKSYSQKGSLDYHYLIHAGQKPFSCDICGTSFRHKSHLESHIRTHTGVKPFQCDICKSSFSSKYHITAHMRTHSGEKPYKCKICGTSFSHKHRLDGHVRTHTGEKPFTCEICKSSFADKSNLINHIRLHSGETPFECDICKLSFGLKTSLKEHMRKHTVEKPFQGKPCKTSLGRRYSLRHLIRIHYGEND